VNRSIHGLLDRNRQVEGSPPASAQPQRLNKQHARHDRARHRIVGGRSRPGNSIARDHPQILAKFCHIVNALIQLSRAAQNPSEHRSKGAKASSAHRRTPRGRRIELREHILMSVPDRSKQHAPTQTRLSVAG